MLKHGHESLRFSYFETISYSQATNVFQFVENFKAAHHFIMIGISYKAAFIAISQKKRNEIFPCPCFPRYGQSNERTSRWSWQMLPQE